MSKLSKIFLTFLLAVSVLFPDFASLQSDLELLKPQTEQLQEIRNSISDTNLELDDLKVILSDGISYMEYLSKLYDSLSVKLQHIEENIKLTNNKLVQIENLRTQYNNDLSQSREIALRIINSNPSLPSDVLKRIGQILSAKLSLQKTLDSLQNENASVAQELASMKSVTMSEISQMTKTIEVKKAEFISSKDRYDSLNLRVKELLTQEENIRQVLIKLTPTEVKDIETAISDNASDTSVSVDMPRDFIWPVEPIRGFSALFMDPSYKKTIGIDHNGLDIPTPQGTEVKAIADAYVLDIKEAQTIDGYQYVILVHLNEIRSVYGHLSQINVKKGDLVRQGDVIGLSGGIPGTKGAGPITTGAHLHLEIIKDGVHVDPLSIIQK